MQGHEALVVVLVTYVVLMNEFHSMVACDVQRFLHANRAILRHVGLFGFMLLVRVLPGLEATPLVAVRDAAFLYVLLVASTKCTLATFVPLTLCVVGYSAAAFYLASDASKRHSAETRRRVDCARRAFQVGAYAFLALGVVLYVLKQRRDHGARFSWRDFVLASGKCRGMRGVDHEAA